MRRLKSLELCELLFFLIPPLFSQQKRPLEAADPFRIACITDPALSPDAKTIIFTISAPDLSATLPDEGRLVLKPKNSEFWHRTVFDWFAQYLKP